MKIIKLLLICVLLLLALHFITQVVIKALTVLILLVLFGGLVLHIYKGFRQNK